MDSITSLHFVVILREWPYLWAKMPWCDLTSYLYFKKMQMILWFWHNGSIHLFTFALNFSRNFLSYTHTQWIFSCPFQINGTVSVRIDLSFSNEIKVPSKLFRLQFTFCLDFHRIFGHFEIAFLFNKTPSRKCSILFRINVSQSKILLISMWKLFKCEDSTPDMEITTQ